MIFLRVFIILLIKLIESYNLGSANGGYNLASRLLSGNVWSHFESLVKLIKGATEQHIHAEYNLGMMYLYGIGIQLSCPEGVKYLKKVTETMVWKKLFKNAHELYVTSQTKTAALMYMILGAIGTENAQINAGNILDSYSVFNEKFWLEQNAENININQYLALKYYKEAEKQNSEFVNLRLGDFYYYGYSTHSDINKSLGYYDRAIHKHVSPTMLSYSWFTIGILHQFGYGMEKSRELAHWAFNKSIESHNTAYYPAEVMKLVLNITADGIQAILPGVKVLPLFASIIFIVSIILFINIRRG